jgi:ribonuclease HI
VPPVSGPSKVIVNVDGGSRGNPGPAAVAAVASDPGGEILAERAALIGETTNNVAEYRALLLGIELAKELGAKELELIGDSALIAHQVRGEWKVKQAHLRPLRAEAVKALEELGKWSIRNVPRAQNERADELLNETLDAAAPGG